MDTLVYIINKRLTITDLSFNEIELLKFFINDDIDLLLNQLKIDSFIDNDDIEWFNLIKQSIIDYQM